MLATRSLNMSHISLTPVQRRALLAAAGLVGRPQLRAGLAMTLAIACVPLDEPGSGSSASDGETTMLASTGSSGATTGGPITGSSGEDSGTSTGDLETSGGDEGGREHGT